MILTEWPIANAANWTACGDAFVRFERWETLEGVDLIFVFLLVTDLGHRLSNTVSVMEFRRQRQECCQSMSWQRCWVFFLSRSWHQSSGVHFYRNGMTGRNRTANVGDAECQLTTMCVRQILLTVFKLDVLHRWYYTYHAFRSCWITIASWVFLNCVHIMTHGCDKEGMCLNFVNWLQLVKFRFWVTFMMSVMDTWPRLVVMVL